MNKSVCMDCEWKNSCQRLERVNTQDGRIAHDRRNDIFEIIIISCSLKNYDRSYKTGGDKEENGMYYCLECNQMHHEWSGVGRLHKKINKEYIISKEGI